MRGVNKKGPMSEVVGRSKHTDAAPKPPEEKKPEEKKLQVKVAEDGSMAGRLGRSEDGQVRLGGLTLKQPADGEVVTHPLSQDKLLVLRGEGNTVSVSTRKLGLEINQEKGKLKGLVLPHQLEGQSVVDLGPLGLRLAPAPGGTDSYLMAADKLLVLQSKDDGTVSVYTRTLGLEGGKKGDFKGDLLPVEGRVEFSGHQLEVGHLKPGQERSEKLRINGKKYEVTLRMNADGSVTVSGEQKKSFWSKLGGILSFAAPILAAIPGLGVGALLAKVVSGFNAVKSSLQAVRNGDLLGLVSSVAGGLTNFSQGAFKAIASSVANVTSFGQQVLGVIKQGLGQGLLPVVSSLANLASGAAGAVAGLGQGATKATAGQLAADFGNVARAVGAGDAALKGNLLPGLGLAATAVVSNLKPPAPPKEQGPGYTIRKDIKQLTPFDSALLPAHPLDPGAPKATAAKSNAPGTAPISGKGEPHYSMQEILANFPERRDMKPLSEHLKFASLNLVMPTQVPISEATRFVHVNSRDASVTPDELINALAESWGVSFDLLKAFDPLNGINLLVTTWHEDGKAYFHDTFSQEFVEFLQEVSRDPEKSREVIAQLKQGATPRGTPGRPTSAAVPYHVLGRKDVAFSANSSNGAQATTQPTNLPSDLKEALQTTQENLALHNDPNKPRLTQGKPDALSGLVRGAGEFRDGLFQGPPGAAGNMEVNLDKATALQIMAAQTVSPAQNLGEKLREAVMFVPGAGVALEVLSSGDLAFNQYKEDIFGRTAGDAAKSAALNALFDVAFGGLPVVPGRGIKPKVDMPGPGVRPDAPPKVSQNVTPESPSASTRNGPEAGGGERPALEGFSYPGVAAPDEFRVIGNKAKPGDKTEWNITHPLWVDRVARDSINQRLKTGDILPMPMGVRPSAGDLVAVTKRAGRELALTFLPNPSGSGPGTYFVHIGDKYSVPLNLREGELLIAHTHPPSPYLPIDAWPSSKDVDLTITHGSHIFGHDRSHTLFTTRYEQLKNDLDTMFED